MDIQIDWEELQRIRERKGAVQADEQTLAADFIEFEGEVKSAAATEPIIARSDRLLKRPPPTTSVLHFDTPWMSKNRRYSNIPVERLHEEIVDFAAYVSPTEEERFARTEAIRRLTTIVNSIWPEATVQVFGSFDSQLYLPSSDLDVVIVHPSLAVDEHSKPPLNKLAKALLKAGIPIPESVKVLTKARIPIVKYMDNQTDFDMDVSFNVTSGLEVASFMQSAMKNQPAVRPLTLVLKHFLEMRALNEVYHGGLGSFSVMCLVISLLQRHPLVQSGLIRAHENLGVILMEFFELYGKHFNSEVVGISVTGTGSYYEKEERGWLQDSKPNMLSIEDPQNADNDVSKGSFAYGAVRQSFEHAFNVLKCSLIEYETNRKRMNGKSDIHIPSMLGSIVTLDDKLLRHRYYIQQTANL
jgi:non-canonical poly(A) RNA polymerase PAPD5/7